MGRFMSLMLLWLPLCLPTNRSHRWNHFGDSGW